MSNDVSRPLETSAQESQRWGEKDGKKRTDSDHQTGSLSSEERKAQDICGITERGRLMSEQRYVSEIII